MSGGAPEAYFLTHYIVLFNQFFKQFLVICWIFSWPMDLFTDGFIFEIMVTV